MQFDQNALVVLSKRKLDYVVLSLWFSVVEVLSLKALSESLDGGLYLLLTCLLEVYLRLLRYDFSYLESEVSDLLLLRLKRLVLVYDAQVVKGGKLH